MPSVQRVYDDLKSNQNFSLLLVSVDNSRSPVDKYLVEEQYTIPVVLDADAEVARSFGVLGTPTTFVIDRNGEMVASGFGPLDFDNAEFRNYLKAFIAN